eukprot:SAG31_NODE_22399_length_526_cov_1.388759_2_plen_85_part_01
MAEAFDRLDRDRSGALDFKELRALVQFDEKTNHLRERRTLMAGMSREQEHGKRKTVSAASQPKTFPVKVTSTDVADFDWAANFPN